MVEEVCADMPETQGCQPLEPPKEPVSPIAEQIPLDPTVRIPQPGDPDHVHPDSVTRVVPDDNPPVEVEVEAEAEAEPTEEEEEEGEGEEEGVEREQKKKKKKKKLVTMMMVMNRRKMAAAMVMAVWRRVIKILTSKDSPTPVEIIEVTSNSILENVFKTNSQ